MTNINRVQEFMQDNQGCSVAEIANTLIISPGTARSCISNLMARYIIETKMVNRTKRYWFIGEKQRHIADAMSRVWI